MISASRCIFSVFILKSSLQYFDCLRLIIVVLWCHSVWKWSARRGASFLSLYRKPHYSIFDRLLIKMTILWCHSMGNWSARRGASFLSLYQKPSTVFRSSTYQKDNIKMTFTRKNDRRVAAYLFCLYIKKTIYSISIVYLSKRQYYDFTQWEKWSAHQAASFGIVSSSFQKKNWLCCLLHE